MSKKMFSEDTVHHVAELCKLKVSSRERKIFAVMFSESLKYIDVLDELDTKNIQETYQVTGLQNVWQEKDDLAVTLSSIEALFNAKNESDGYFVTPAVFDRL